MFESILCHPTIYGEVSCARVNWSGSRSACCLKPCELFYAPIEFTGHLY